MKSPVKWRFLFVMVLMVDNLRAERCINTTKYAIINVRLFYIKEWGFDPDIINIKN